MSTSSKSKIGSKAKSTSSRSRSKSNDKSNNKSRSNSKTKTQLSLSKKKNIILDSSISRNSSTDIIIEIDKESNNKISNDSITTLSTTFTSLYKNNYGNIINNNINIFQYYLHTKDYNLFYEEYNNLKLSYTDHISIFIPKEKQKLKGEIKITPQQKCLSVALSFNIPKEINKTIIIDIKISLFSNQKKYFLLKAQDKMKLTKEHYMFVFKNICENKAIMSENLSEPFIINISMSTQARNYERINDYNGLINEGNTCYMNVILQTLCHIPFIRNRIMTMETNDKIIVSLKKIFYELLFSLQKTDSNNNDDDIRVIENSVKILHLFNAFEWNKSIWNGQQDAEEIFTQIYSHIDNIDKSIVDKNKDKRSKKYIHNECEGELKTSIICKKINHSSNKKEAFLFLQLEINQTRSLKESLDHFFATEELIENNQYQHDNKKYYDAHKKCYLSHIPNILFIQLKRFQMIDRSQDKHQLKKNCRFISYPPEIDLSAYANHFDSQPDLANIPSIYNLYAVIVHDGTFNHGHYYTFIKDFNKSKWILFNDTKVSYASINEIFEENYGGDDYDIEIDINDNYSLRKKLKEKTRTAYILIYVSKDKSQELFNERDTKEIMEKIKEEMNIRSPTK